MSKNNAVNLSIENGVLVIECLKEIRITIPDTTRAVHVNNISGQKLVFGHNLAAINNGIIVEYYLDANPNYRFIGSFKQPKTARYIHGIFSVVIGEGEGCLITLPNSKENVFVYNESGLLCFRGPSKIIDKTKTTAFKVK